MAVLTEPCNQKHHDEHPGVLLLQFCLDHGFIIMGGEYFFLLSSSIFVYAKPRFNSYFLDSNETLLKFMSFQILLLQYWMKILDPL